jgi:hypothetical protein
MPTAVVAVGSLSAGWDSHFGKPASKRPHKLRLATSSHAVQIDTQGRTPVHAGMRACECARAWLHERVNVRVCALLKVPVRVCAC